jgi:antitoxin PrlF|tara:strand:- start:1409 stop:1783 length:375 start_codon:yes stop_codon:yes gene_type:complete
MRLHYYLLVIPIVQEAAMATLEVESKLTDRYQTTVPETVRRALKLNKRDKIHYVIRQNGEVVLTRATNEGDDPALGSFLDFLARDIAEHPEHIQAVEGALIQRIQSLTEGIEVDLDVPLQEDDE